MPSPPGQSERERAQERTRGEKGRLPRDDRSAQAWGWCHTDLRTSQNAWARLGGPSTALLVPSQAGRTPSSCGTASRRNEPRVGTSSSCPQAPWLGRPCCPRAIIPDVHLQLSLAPTRTQLGPDLIAHPSFTPIFHVLTSVDGGTEPTGANICRFLLGGGHFGLVPP